MTTNIGRQSIRQGFSALLSALLLVLSVAVPLLERADFLHEERWESHHDPEECVPAHDHTICTQVRANLWIPTSRTVGTHFTPRMGQTVAVTGVGRTQSPLPEGNPTRAPPAA